MFPVYHERPRKYRWTVQVKSLKKTRQDRQNQSQQLEGDMMIYSKKEIHVTRAKPEGVLDFIVEKILISTY